MDLHFFVNFRALCGKRGGLSAAAGIACITALVDRGAPIIYAAMLFGLRQLFLVLRVPGGKKTRPLSAPSSSSTT